MDTFSGSFEVCFCLFDQSGDTRGIFVRMCMGNMLGWVFDRIRVDLFEKSTRRLVSVGSRGVRLFGGWIIVASIGSGCRVVLVVCVSSFLTLQLC